MQPAKLGAPYWCLLAGTILGLMLAPSASAQTSIETQQQTNDKIRDLSAKSATPLHDYIIGRGDVISVEVYDVQELTRDLRVSQTGTIGIPLLPTRLFVAGLTEIQVQRKIAEVLQANGLVTNPQVMVSVKERRSKPITIVGAVVHSMVYQADHPVTLVEVLAEAGGIAPDASDTVLITRGALLSNLDSNEPPDIAPEDAVPITNPSSPTADTSATAAIQPPDATATNNASNGNSVGAQPTVAGVQPVPPSQEIPPQTSPQNAPVAAPPPTATPPPISNAQVSSLLPNTISVSLSELLERANTENNIQLQAGDVVTVPHAGIVYALGAVQRPGEFVSNNDRAQLTTLKLLALSGGMTRVAKKTQAVIIRKDSTGKQEAIPVDLQKIVKRESEDVRLMPSDILYVPDSPRKAALIRAGEIGLGVSTGLLIYRIGTR
jgi:polysaccharide export outer membrane protein